MTFQTGFTHPCPQRPFLLARYLRIRAGEALRIDPHATAVIYYAIQGTGEIVHHSQNLAWSTGDIFCVPGGDATLYAQSDSMLWGVGNEPEVAFHGLELPVAADDSSRGLIHFSATETRRYLDQVCATPAPPDATGRVIIFTTDGFEKTASLTPSMTLALNTMDPGQAQKAHRHNSAAITLVIEGHACYSIVDGNRSDWERYATMVTPAAASHSHHNDGDGIALFLIVQDGGLFYQARAIGFSLRLTFTMSAMGRDQKRTPIPRDVPKHDWLAPQSPADKASNLHCSLSRDDWNRGAILRENKK